MAIRIRLLNKLLKDYDDGRSKSSYCLAVTLLPIEELKIAMNELRTINNKANDRKQVANMLKEIFNKLSKKNGIELIYRNKKA